MFQRKRPSVALLVLSLLLFGVQAGLWAHSTAHARTETDKQNLMGKNPPTEVPGAAGMLLLVAAAVIASRPLRALRARHRS